MLVVGMVHVSRQRTHALRGLRSSLRWRTLMLVLVLSRLFVSILMSMAMAIGLLISLFRFFIIVTMLTIHNVARDKPMDNSRHNSDTHHAAQKTPNHNPCRFLRIEPAILERLFGGREHAV